MKVVQPVGVFPRAAKAAVHCAPRNIPWTRYSIALITKPAATPPNNNRGRFGRAVVVISLSQCYMSRRAGGRSLGRQLERLLCRSTDTSFARPPVAALI